METTIWVSDSDLCDNCGALLGDFRECPECGWEGVDWGDECDDEEDEDVYYVGEYDQEVATERRW